MSESNFPDQYDYNSNDDDDDDDGARKKKTPSMKKGEDPKKKKKRLDEATKRAEKSNGFFKRSKPHTYGTLREGYHGNALKSVSGHIYEVYNPKKKYTDKYMEGKIIIKKTKRGGFVNFKKSRDAKERLKQRFLNDPEFKQQWEDNQGVKENLLNNSGRRFSNLKNITERGYFSSKGNQLRKLVVIKRKSGGQYAQKSKEHCEKNHEKAKEKKMNVLGHHCHLKKSKKKKSQRKSKSKKSKKVNSKV